MMNKIHNMMIKNIKKSIRFAVWCIAFFITALVLVQIIFWGGIVWLNSKNGQQVLQSALGQQLQDSGYRIEFKGLSYAVPTHIRLGRIKIYEHDAVLAEAEKIRLDIDKSLLWQKTFSIDSNIGKLTLHKRAKEKQETEKKPVALPVIINPVESPEMYFTKIVIEDIAIDDVLIKDHKTGGEKHFSPILSGKAVISEDGIVSAGFSIKNRDKTYPANASIKGTYAPKTSSIALDEINITTPDFTLSGKGKAVFQESGDVLLEGTAAMPKINGLSPLVFRLDAENTGKFTGKAALTGAYLKKDIALKTTFTLDKDILSFSGINITAPDFQASGNVGVNMTTTRTHGSLSGTLHKLSSYQYFTGPGHDLGRTKFDMTFNNKGKITLKADAQFYRNEDIGIKARDIQLAADMTGQKITVHRLTLRDEDKGTMEASGHFDRHAQNMDFTLKAQNLHALKGDKVDGIIDADLALKGQEGVYNISGKVMPDYVSIKLPERFSSSIPQLNIKKPGDKKGKSSGEVGKNIALNVQIDAPKKITVQGWGLDTEFGGNLKVSGYLNDPQIHGKLDLVRGRYTEFGKSFTLAKAALKFAGSVPPSPALDIVAQTQADDITAQVLIGGSAVRPKISFASVPALPEDEVLARVLFGKNMENISPLQAVQLTQTLQRFSGQGGGSTSLDPVGALRGITGLDDLRVDTDEEGGASIGAGKQLSDKVYLEFETGSEGAGNANLEVEITPNITFESEIGQDASGGGGIFWTHDY